jgi:hypothetical protein
MHGTVYEGQFHPSLRSSIDKRQINHTIIDILYHLFKTHQAGHLRGMRPARFEIGPDKRRMNMMIVTDWVHVIAGLFILGSLALGTWVHPYWYFFTAFVGLNLFQYGFTKFCPMATILKKVGVPEQR